MFHFNWQALSKEFRGSSIMIFGIVLLFYTLNIFQKWLTLLLVLCSLALIAYGFDQAELWNKIKVFKKKL